MRHSARKGKRAKRIVLGQFEINLDRLCGRSPSLVVRYAHNGHSVPDMRETRVGPHFVGLLLHLTKHYHRYKEVHSGHLRTLPIDKLPVEDADWLLMLLHRSKALTGGDIAQRRQAIGKRYDGLRTRLDIILGEIDAGNDNPDLKIEGKHIADTLRAAKRISAAEKARIISLLADPPTAPTVHFGS